MFENYIAKDKSGLIPLLQDVQSIYGYLPENALQEISDFLEMYLGTAYNIAALNRSFKFLSKIKSKKTIINIKGK